MVAWRITQLEYNVNDGGVLAVHWNATTDQATVDNEPYVEKTYGVCSFIYDTSNEDFIPLNDLTEQVVLGWVWDQDIGYVDKDATEQMLEENLSEKVSPTIATGLPWA
jgi:hypothetical protein